MVKGLMTNKEQEAWPQWVKLPILFLLLLALD